MKRLVLAGGGHAHVEVLRRFAQSPEPDTELVLVSPADETPYSGMLPGVVAGHYARRDAHIDLRVLCVAARARFVRRAVTAIEPSQRWLTLAGGESLAYDLVSLDVGSTPPLPAIPGAAEVGTPVKPVDSFLDAWTGVLASAGEHSVRIVVVGLGAGGVEIALAMGHRLRGQGGPGPSRVSLLGDSSELLPGHADGVRCRVAARLSAQGLQVRTGVRIVSADRRGLLLADRSRVAADWIVWITGAAAPAWLDGSGLARDARGFVEVDATLRSTSHPEVFAAGDVASMRGAPRPKSGVHAVRQGPPLAANLRAALRGAPLLPHVPQARALSLISTGDRHAVASWGRFSVEGGWVWRWKDLIDRRFMSRYR